MSYIHYTQFDISRVIGTNFEAKTSSSAPDKKDDVSYNTLPVAYRYPNPSGGDDIEGPLCIHLGRHYCSRGLKIKPFGGKDVVSVGTVYDVATHPEYADLVGGPPDLQAYSKLTIEQRNALPFWEKLWCLFAEKAFAQKEKLGLTSVRSRADMFNAVKQLIIFKYDDEDGKVRTDVPGSRYHGVKYRKYINGDKINEVKALFYMVTGPKPEDRKEIPWDTLSRSSFTFDPTVHIKSVYSGGGRISIQITITSAIVLEVKTLENTSIDPNQISSYVSDSDFVAKMRQQLVDLGLLPKEETKEDESSDETKLIENKPVLDSAVASKPKPAASGVRLAPPRKLT